MLIQGTCPQCGGFATIVEGTISCALCGDVSGQDSESEGGLGGLLSDGLATTEEPEVFLDVKQEVPVDFCRQRVDVVLTTEEAGRLPNQSDERFDQVTERALEFYFQFVASFGDTLDMPILATGRSLTVELTSSQAFFLEELARKSGKANEELVAQALRLYIEESEELGQAQD